MPEALIEFQHRIKLVPRDVTTLSSKSKSKFHVTMESIALKPESRNILSKWPWLLQHFALFPDDASTSIFASVVDGANLFGVNREESGSVSQHLPSSKFAPSNWPRPHEPATDLRLPISINVAKYDFTDEPMPEQKQALINLIRSTGSYVKYEQFWSCPWLFSENLFIHRTGIDCQSIFSRTSLDLNSAACLELRNSLILTDRMQFQNGLFRYQVFDQD
jgi:hypothetical protein